MRCSYCGSNYHAVINCPKTWQGSSNRANMRCSYCGAVNHSIQACPKTYSGNADRAWNKKAIADHYVEDNQ